VDLDGNNVRARLYNTGSLFWKGSGNLYRVPREGEADAIFASGIWIGGLDANGALRFAGTAYGPFEYFPGPLDASGNPPTDCSVYDHIYRVSRQDIALYDLNGTSTADMIDWPWQLGAPVRDGDGNPDNYSLAGGDRPGLIGEQTAWWVMNDAGGPKNWSRTRPIGLEVQVTAFVLAGSDALDNTTFYWYRIVHKGSQTLSRTWFGIWSDPDLGNSADDYVGSDTTLGIGFVYNGDAVDEGADGYGVPPALGYDFLQGPLVPDPSGGTWIDPDGTEHPDSTRRRMTNFVFYSSSSSPYGNPSGATFDPYRYLQSIWRDGTPMTVGGNGYGGTERTTFMFPGDPVTGAFWSEANTDGQGSRNVPSDRRFLMSTGPFDLEPGDVQEIVYAVVWSQSTDHLASVTKLRLDDIRVQAVYDNGLRTASPPDAPVVTWDAYDRGVVLEWSNPPESNNFLNGYDEEGAFLVVTDPPDGNTTYTFEGYEVIRFATPTDARGEVVATYDARNGIERIVDEVQDPVTGLVGPFVAAEGTDRGVQGFHLVDGLVNFRDYDFGVRAYGYNPHARPRVLFSPVSRVTVRPAPVANRAGGMALAPGVVAGETVIPSVRTAGVGTEGGVFARVTSPGRVTGDRYEVSVLDPVGGQLRYDLRNATSGAVLVDGEEYLAETGHSAPFGHDFLSADGLSFSLSTVPPSITAFTVTANAGGVLEPPGMAALAFNGNGFPFYNGTDRPSAGQQSTNSGLWGIHTGEGNGDRYDDFVRRSIRNGWDNIVPHDFEIRFTAECRADWEDSVSDGDAYDEFPTSACYGYDRFAIITGDADTPTIVPFELWDVGIDTPDDPSDDVRLIPALIDWEGDGFSLQCRDHEVSGGSNDPSMDWTYWYLPAGNDRTPGEAGYNAWAADLLAGTPDNHGSELMARQVLVLWNGGTIAADCPTYPDRFTGTSPFASEMPEVGTVFRISTSKPLTPGDVFEIDSAPYAPIRGVFETADDSTRQALLDLIGVVPNPYKGASAYERDPVNDEVRFVNLPDEVTIRIFTLAGTQVRTLEKNGPSPVLRWDLRNEYSMPVASGMYLVHVEAPGLGEKVIKLGVVRGRMRPGGD
jgi:hypothetical protein